MPWFMVLVYVYSIIIPYVVPWYHGALYWEIVLVFVGSIAKMIVTVYRMPFYGVEKCRTVIPRY